MKGFDPTSNVDNLIINKTRHK